MPKWLKPENESMQTTVKGKTYLLLYASGDTLRHICQIEPKVWLGASLCEQSKGILMSTHSIKDMCPTCLEKLTEIENETT